MEVDLSGGEICIPYYTNSLDDPLKKVMFENNFHTVTGTQ